MAERPPAPDAVAEAEPARVRRTRRRAGDDLDPAAGALLRMATGEREAVGALYDLLAGPVYGTIRRVVRDPARSEELTQEVFVTAWRTAARFDPGRGSGRTWLLTIAHRRAVDCVRSERRRREREAREAVLQRVVPDGPAEVIVDRAERGLLVDALRRLSAPQRESIELAYYGGHTHREIADLLGLPLGTVKTRIRDGLQRLRDVLGVER